MNLEELDRQLGQWRKSVATVVANVYELYEHPVYRALTASASVAGASRQPLEQACESVRHLLLCGNELQAVVERAGKLREAMPRLFREEAIREIDQLLHGPSIRLPDTDVPLWQRGLLSEAARAGQALSIQQMLEAMVPDFEAAKHTIFEVDRIWATLGPRLEAADAELASLRALSEKTAPGDAPDLSDLQRRIEDARQRVRSDPFGAAQGVENGLAPVLSQARARLEQLTAERRQTEAALARAHGLQHELREVHARAVVAVADRQSRVTLEKASIPNLPLADGELEDARRWLEQLDAMMPDAHTRHSVAVGVRRWLEAAHRHLTHDQTALRENQALLDERLELRGRLDALTAKAAGCGLAEDPLLAADAQSARALLYRRPTPLEEARRSVARYQAGLNETIAGSARR